MVKTWFDISHTSKQKHRGIWHWNSEKEFHTATTRGVNIFHWAQGSNFIQVQLFKRWQHTNRFGCYFFFDFTTWTKYTIQFPADLVANSDEICGERCSLISSCHNLKKKNETNYVSTLPYSESYTFAQNTLKPKSQQFAALVLFESTCAGGISDKGINQYAFYCLTRK